MANDDENSFDAIVVGTGLTESILAAALSKAKYKVAHIDPNPYYGGNEASLSQDEFVKWGEQVSNGLHPAFSSYSGDSQVLPYSRQYSICLRPSIIPSLGPLITGLIASGVAKYSGFKLLDSVSIYAPDGSVKSVPGSKDAIFKSKDISLIEKRRLMRFLTFASGDFEDKPEIQGKEEQPFPEYLNSSDPTLPSLLRLRSFLRSVGRYGPSPFLVGHYGGIGDISQGFCRAAAVNGGVYVLGRPILSTTFHTPTPDEAQSEPYIEMKLDDFPEVLKSRVLISSKVNKPPGTPVLPFEVSLPTDAFQTSFVSKVARCVAILDKALSFHNTETTADPDSPPSRKDPLDSSVLIFPPASLPGGSQTNAGTVLINGEGSLSTPKQRWIVYIMLPLTSLESESDVETILRPYLDAVLHLTGEAEAAPVQPLSTSFFLEKQTPDQSSTSSAPQDTPRHFLIPPLAYSTFPELPDSAAKIAEIVFHQAIRSLRALKGDASTEEEEVDFWPPMEPEEEDSDDE
ncbi:hypothetical protein H1R20_g12118, partial [Candolleomyces eurysporus]